MERKKIIILSIVIILCGAVIAGVCMLFNSPEWALKQMREDIAGNGIGALRAYLTEDLQHTFDNVETALGFAGSLASGFGKVTEGVSRLIGMPDAASGSRVKEMVDSLKEEAGTFKISLNKVEHKGNTAIAALDYSVSSFAGSAVLTMIRQNGRWLISEMNLPDLGLTLGPQ